MTLLPGRIGAPRVQQSSARAKFRKHKVILESVTQKRKKLRSIISFEVNAPAGYTFIPAGNPRFTIACKESCREQALKVYTVTTTPHQNTHGLSQQVHRVGYHFPSTVVAKKCMELGLYLSENGNVMAFENFGTNLTRPKDESEVDQVTINTEARDVIRDLFPKIPDEDIALIIKTAFQKGERKVGTAVELPLARRAQLAVVAHIRHMYTDYDKLLKKTSFQEARRQVEDVTLEKLVQWRGDDESGMPVLEDVFREVIVISDDEGDDEDDETPLATGVDHKSTHARDPSVEIVSTNVVNKLDISTDDGGHSVSTFPIKANKEPLAKTYLFTRGTRNDNTKVDRRGFSRYQAWDRAMSRYREKKLLRYGEKDSSRSSTVHGEVAAGSSKTPYTRVNQPPLSGRPLTPIIERIFDPSFKGATYEIRPHSSDRFRHTRAQYPQDDNRTLLSGSEAPDILHFPDGSVFGKIPPVTSHARISRTDDIASVPVFVAGPRSFTEGLNDPTQRKRVHPGSHRAATNHKVDGSPRNKTIIPSIEHRESPVPARFSAGHRISDSSIIPGSIPRDSTQYRPPLDELSKGIDLIDLTEDTSEFTKRRRLYNQYSESMAESSKVNRVPFRRLDPAAYILNEPREETHHLPYRPKEMPRISSGMVPAIPTISLDHPGSHSIPSVDHLPRYRDSSFMADGYETEAPGVTHFREDRPASGHHVRGSGSDDATWRNKANSYRSQRRLLEAQDPTWSMSVPRSSFQGSRVQIPERAIQSPAFNQEDVVEPAPNFKINATAENASQHYARRVSSQPPLLDTQRKRDTLPASAMRRYEVQLEKSINSSRGYEPAPHQER